MRTYRLWIAGAWREAGAVQTIASPYSGEPVAQAPVASRADVQDAIAASVAGFAAMRSMPAHARSALLLRLRDGLRERREEFARVIVEEAGKPLTDARVEVERALNVLTLSAEEAKRIGGEVLSLDLDAASEGRFGVVRRFPVGPVAGITPYNFPLNLGIHKVGPALAAGCSIVWKPSLLAPGPAFLFAELAEAAGAPRGALNVVAPTDEEADPLVTDPRLRLLSFTGSARVGWQLRARAGAKRVLLELGGNAAVVIGADADLDLAAQRCAAGGYAYAGQVCISVQRVLVEASAYEAFLERFVPLVRGLPLGDPMLETTRVGPMVNAREADRVERWIVEAVAGGAQLLVGGERRGLMITPAVLVDVPETASIVCQEAFGPLVVVAPFETWEEALQAVNRSVYGLQAGIFTQSLARTLAAFQMLEVGAVIVNDVPAYRMDHMPYGGVKESGLGREGVRYAIEEMTEPRLLALRA